MNCFRCGQPGHFAAQCPLGRQAASYEEHMGRIRGFIDRWIGGELTLTAKRAAISGENLLWYGPGCPRRLLWP